MSSCPSLHRKFDPKTGYSQGFVESEARSKSEMFTKSTFGKRDEVSYENRAANPNLLRPKESYSGGEPLGVLHNLQLSTYSFDDILGMFGLSYNITVDDLKSAKRKVLMVHPDKSHLPSEYFLFYKRAFEMVVQYYYNHAKQTHVVDETTPTDYVPMTPENTYVRDTVQKLETKQFNSRFNELFEQNMWEKPDETQNAWFRTESAPAYIAKTPVSVSNMSSIFDDIKTQQHHTGLVRYSGVRELSTTRGGASFHDDPNAGRDEYVSSDPFSKLPFEDLRKVHKDQTVFAVSEREYDAMPKYANVEQYATHRNSGTLTPMEKADAQRLFDQRESIAHERAARQQYEANLKSQEYAEKNKRIMGAFLHIGNV